MPGLTHLTTLLTYTDPICHGYYLPKYVLDCVSLAEHGANQVKRAVANEDY